MSKLHVTHFFLLIGLLLVNGLKIQAQNAEPVLKVADKLFENGDYYGSIIFYEKAMDIDSNNAEVLYKYGRNLSFINNHNAASRYLYKALLLDRNKEYELLPYELAESYRSAGEYRKARRYYNQALRPYRSKRNSYWYKRISISKDAASWANKDNSTATIEPSNVGRKVNSNFSEFGATIANGNLYFSAMIADSIVAGNIINDKHYFSRIYSQSLKNNLQKVNQLSFDKEAEKVISAQHISNPSILGNEIYFSICDTNFKCEIWKGELKNNQVSSISKLNRNINNVSANNTQGQAYVWEGDTFLLFTSDRAKGFGGLDVWKSKKESFGFGEPINLGSVINSPDNEITPFFDETTGTLYFSSNWHIGYGGYDVFESELVDRQFRSIKNMGKNINSNFNEYYFQPTGKVATFSSNRTTDNVEGSSSCCNDLYQVAYKKEIVLVEKVKKDTVNEEILNKYLPLSLYFHNDSPDPRSKDSTTEKSYLNLANEYISMEEEYLNEYIKSLPREQRENKEVKLMEFFENNVSDGLSDLVIFTPLLLRELEKGSKVELSVRGFASSLSNPDYNLLLTSRRIESLINYFSDAELGKFKPFLADGSLVFNKLPYGEFAVSNQIDETNTIEAIYSPEAAQERKIELIAINSTSERSVLNLEAVPKVSFNKRAYNVSNVKQGEIVQRSFILKNSGAGELKLYRVSTNLDAVELEHPKQVAPSETENITVTVNTKELLGEVKVEVLVVSNDSQNTLIKLLIDLNVVQ